MANTYKKIYIHIIFAVKNREALLEKSYRDRVFGYLHEAINIRGNYCFKVGGHLDHVHIFFDYKGKELLEDLVREIKKSSNQFINDQKFTPFKFEWQSGYGGFSVGYREKDVIINYIANQEEHHSNKKSIFRKEYMNLLENYEIEFIEEYVFDFFDEMEKD